MDSRPFRTVRWEDISPHNALRAAWDFTLNDAGAAVPTILVMICFFIACVLILLVIKRLVMWIFLRKELGLKYVLIRTTHTKGEPPKEHWVRQIPHNAGSILHAVLETAFIAGIVVALLFSAAIGDVNIWTSPVALSLLAVAAGYMFGGPISLGAWGYAFLLFIPMRVGEYWLESGSNGAVGGRVTSISLFFVWFERRDSRTGGARIQRVSMTSVMNGNWEQDPEKQLNEPPVCRDCFDDKRVLARIKREGKEEETTLAAAPARIATDEGEFAVPIGDDEYYNDDIEGQCPCPQMYAQNEYKKYA